ncbi:hypothetical protein [Arthrobacter sp. V4I6]|uniref:cupredoxin domain-containing protein n=1 Tax=Arthrobacter sp. V4I6 TaxID=3042281 RepID=UPI0027D89742|nr:hypothetical protein [Arthrobacter sp. V4I6]
MTTACTPAPGETDAGAPTPDGHREVVLDLGAADVVDLRPVTVQAAPGDVVVLRSGNPGRGPDDESPVHHLFTSAPEGTPPPLFIPAGGGLAPNPGVWGVCRGGEAANATSGCPVPPIEGPRHYDGRSYFSLGALLPGEQRELPLSEDLEPGTYRFTCAVHPHLHVDVEVVEDPAPASPRPPLEAAEAKGQARGLAAAHAEHRAVDETVVLLAPQPENPPAEVLQAVPAEVHVAVGGTVVWRNPSRAPHTVELGINEAPHLTHTAPADTVPIVPADGRWDGEGRVQSGILSTGVGRTELRLTFTRPGLYVAYDRFAPSVTTQVRVG